MEIKRTERKNVATLINGKEDTCVSKDIDAEEESILAAYPETRVSGQRSKRIYRIPITSTTHPESRVTLVITLEHYYPYQSPTISLESPLSSQILLMKPELLQPLYEEISECVETCKACGLGCVTSVIQIVTNALENAYYASPPPVKAPVEEPPKERNEGVQSKDMAPGSSPSLTPIPLRAKDAQDLTMLTCHLLKKCCYLRNPDSLEEVNDNFEKLQSYFFSRELLPYKKFIFPWREENFLSSKRIKQEREMAMSQKHVDPVIQWIWEMTGAPVHTSAGKGRYHDEFIEMERLGSGGFATVVVCRKKLDGRLYAVKKIVMHKNKANKVLQEVKTMANLNHKNIVRYNDAWVEDGYSDDLKCFVKDLEGETTDEEEEDDDDDDDSDDLESWERSDSDESLCHYRTYNSSSDGTSSSLSAMPNPNYQTLYIQMELCSSKTLRDLLNGENGKNIFHSEVGVKLASSILRQLLAVIAHTHHSKIIHRDLKPENILFDASQSIEGETADCTIRVVDFGLAREIESKRVGSCMVRPTSSTTLANESLISPNINSSYPTHVTQASGTMIYSAPEQGVEGASLTIKVDEFSVGMIALEMWLEIERVSYRDAYAIMTDIWSNPTATLPEWFVERNEGIAKIIQSLTNHSPSARKSCEDVLRDNALPGDPEDLVAALDVIDHYGSRMVGSVMQRVFLLEYQGRMLTDHALQYSKALVSDSWTQLVNVSEMIGTIHGFHSMPLIRHLVPVSQKLQSVTNEYMINSSGWSYIYSSFPHYAILSHLSSLYTEEHVSPFFNFYSKDRPYINFTTPFKKDGRNVDEELYAEPLYCFLHLLCCCTKASGTVVITVSHTRWMHAVMAIARGGQGVETLSSEIERPSSTKPPAPTVGHLSLSSLQVDPVFSVPATPRLQPSPTPKIQTPPLGPMKFKLHESSGADDGFTNRRYSVDKEKTGIIDKILEQVISDLCAESNYQKTEKLQHYMLTFTTVLMDAVKAFEKYKPPHLSVKVEIVPSYQPSTQEIPRDILYSDSVLVQCSFIPSSYPPSPPLPIAFGCTVDESSTSLVETPRSQGFRAFVLSIDANQFMEGIRSTPISLPSNYAVLHGVGLRPAMLMGMSPKKMLETAVDLWWMNFRTCLACRDIDERLFTYTAKNIRYLFVNANSLVHAGNRKPLEKTRVGEKSSQTLSGNHLREKFLALAKLELREDMTSPKHENESWQTDKANGPENGYEKHVSRKEMKRKEKEEKKRRGKIDQFDE